MNNDLHKVEHGTTDTVKFYTFALNRLSFLIAALIRNSVVAHLLYIIKQFFHLSNQYFNKNVILKEI